MNALALLPWLLLASPALAEDPLDAALAEDPAGAARAEVDALRAELEALRAEAATLREEVRERRDATLEAEDEAETRRLERAEARALRTGQDRVSLGGATVVSAGERVPAAVAVGADVVVAGEVDGDATSVGGDVHVREGGVVRGDAVSLGGQVVVEDGGTVKGDRVSVGGGARATGAVAASGIGSAVASLYRRLVLLLSFAGAGVLVVGLFPERVGRIAETIRQRPGESGAIGLIGSMALGVAALLFILTFVGSPIGFLLLALLGLAWLMGFVGLCQAMGDRLPFRSRVHGRWTAFLVGVLVVTFAGALPWVGTLVVILASLLGMGAAMRSRFGSA